MAEEEQDQTMDKANVSYYDEEQQQQKNKDEEEKNKDEEEENSPVEQVAATVSTEDDETQPVWTFRMWSLGLLSCVTLSFLNQFFGYRTEPLIITPISVQVAALPAGVFMARVLPDRKFRLLGRQVSLNPGPFNMKEHVLITIFASAGYAFGNGPAYAVGIVDIIRAFYGRSIPLLASWLIIITTQVLGYGWAGLLRKYVVEPAHMWWPSTLVQVSLFRALHQTDDDADGASGVDGASGAPAGPRGRKMTRSRFFMIAMACSFCWYVMPGYLFTTLTSISWVCWLWPRSVVAQQLGSGMRGLGFGAFSLDWGTTASFLFSPLVSPFFAIMNVLAGYLLIVYVAVPIAYWGTNLSNARRYPIFSSHLFDAEGQTYNVSQIVNERFELDTSTYASAGRVHMSTFFALAYGFNFATIASTISHVGLFYGCEIWHRARAASTEKADIHTRLMRKYPDIPHWWFYAMLAATLSLSFVMCEVYKDQVQLPWWALLLACLMASGFTLPISIITATTNQTPGLNVITEYIMGYILPGKPLANVCFKVYGYMSMSQAVAFLQDFKLGHYMKVPPRSMFLVQLIGTIVAGTVNLGVAWWLLGSVDNICQTELLPADSPWTCPGDRVFFAASVIWGLVGPRRIFGSQGAYPEMNWFFLVGLAAPVGVWLLYKAWPTAHWLRLVNMPVLLGSTANMPPATPVNYTMWVTVGTVFNFYVYRRRQQWWRRYNYVLSAGLDAGMAFMAVLIYLALGIENTSVKWWCTQGEHCPLASCPTAPGIHADGCPAF